MEETKPKMARWKVILMGFTAIFIGQLIAIALTQKPTEELVEYPPRTTLTKEKYMESIKPKFDYDPDIICAYETTIDQYGPMEVYEMDKRAIINPEDLDQRFIDNYQKCINN